MTRAIRVSEPASGELTEAVRWYEARRPGLGGDFLDSVAETFTRIEAHPEIGALSRHARRTRRLLVPRFPFQVVYHLRPTEIVIVAVAHQKRRPGYWKNRV